MKERVSPGEANLEDSVSPFTTAIEAASQTPALRRDLRAIVGDGVAYSVMLGLGEAYLPAFALAAGMGDVVAGLTATLPMLVGACLQLVTPAAVRVLDSHRRWVVFCAGAQAASFLPLVAAALLGRVPLFLLFACAALYWGFGMATSPAWNTWVGTIVPAPMRARFFAARARWCQVATLGGLTLAGAALELGADVTYPLVVFAALFAGAALARVVSSRFLARQSEPRPIPRGNLRISPSAFAAHLRGHGHGRLLGFLLAVQLAVHVAAPFFTPYMLGPLNLSYGWFTALTAAAFLARVLVLPALGRLAQQSGTRTLLWIGGLGVIPLPALWLVSSAPGYLLALQVLAGAAWAAFELASLLGFFESIPAADRTSVLSIFNLASALAIAVGSLLGSFLLAAFDGTPEAFAWLFLASTAARLLTLPLLRRAGAVLAPPPRELALRTLTVRPSLGALQRPIVGTLSETDSRSGAVDPE